MTVDLPAPVSPTSAKVSPARISRSTPFSAWWRSDGGRPRSRAAWGRRDRARAGTPRRPGSLESGGVAKAHVLETQGALQAPGAEGVWTMSGVRVSSDMSSAIRPTETRVCCQESKTWDSCWIGEKNRSM